MTVAVPAPVRRVLEQGDFCHVAALTPKGPHVTPTVFATAGDRVWVTTSRGSSVPFCVLRNTIDRCPVASTAERGTLITRVPRAVDRCTVANIPGLSRSPGFASSTRMRAVRVAASTTG